MAGAEEPSQLPGEPGVAELQRDYAALKSPRAPAGQPTITVPIIRVIDLKSGAVGPGILPAPNERMARGGKKERELAKEREKSRNWLINGVVAQAKADAQARNAGPSAESEDATTAHDPLTGALLSQASEGTDPAVGSGFPFESPREKRDDHLSAATNPLTPFMSLWMRPEDFELLAGGRAPLGDDLPAPAPIHAQAGDPLLASPRGFGSSSFVPVSSASDAANPYLQNAPTDLAAWRAAGESVHAASQPAPLAPVESAGGAVAPSQTPPLLLSEKLKARDDARYFKQLKRF
jgi:hypothetical protein